MAETFGVDGRGRFYDAVGAIRDVLQNHLLQVIAWHRHGSTAVRDASALRSERARLLRSILPLDPAHVVRGQYRGYRDEPGVALGSQTETCCAVRLRIANWRWSGVPFCIRAGKRLAVTATEALGELHARRAPSFRTPWTGRATTSASASTRPRSSPSACASRRPRAHAGHADRARGHAPDRGRR